MGRSDKLPAVTGSADCRHVPETVFEKTETENPVIDKPFVFSVESLTLDSDCIILLSLFVLTA